MNTIMAPIPHFSLYHFPIRTMIEDLSGQLEKCYRAKDWYDLAIEAKDDVIKVGRVLQKTAQDRILALERDIALIKEKLLALDTATASLALPVGESIPPSRGESGPLQSRDMERRTCAMILGIAAPGGAPIRDESKEEPVEGADSGPDVQWGEAPPADIEGESQWMVVLPSELTPQPLSLTL